MASRNASLRQLWSGLGLGPANDVGNSEVQVQKALGLIDHVQEAPSEVFSIQRFHRTLGTGEARGINLGKW